MKKIKTTFSEACELLFAGEIVEFTVDNLYTVILRYNRLTVKTTMNIVTVDKIAFNSICYYKKEIKIHSTLEDIVLVDQADLFEGNNNTCKGCLFLNTLDDKCVLNSISEPLIKCRETLIYVNKSTLNQ